MNSIEIKKGRKKYNKLQTEKEHYLRKKQELEELKKDPKIQYFLKIIKYLDRHSDKEYTKDNIISKSFGNIANNTKDSYHILVFLGFKDICDEVTVDPKKIDYASFMDLETMLPYRILPAYYDEFCKDKKVVHFDDPSVYHNSGYYMQKFFRLRSKFFENLVELYPEQAIKKIVR